jgi:hypothetical protein
MAICKRGSASPVEPWAPRTLDQARAPIPGTPSPSQSWTGKPAIPGLPCQTPTHLGDPVRQVQSLAAQGRTRRSRRLLLAVAHSSGALRKANRAQPPSPRVAAATPQGPVKFHAEGPGS